MATLVINRDTNRLQRSLEDDSPALLADILKPYKRSTTPIEVYMVDNHGGAIAPNIESYLFTIARPAEPVPSGVMVITWDMVNSAEISLDGVRLAPRIEAAMNGIPNVASVGGVSVEEVSANRIYSITWREPGNRAIGEVTVTSTLVPSLAAMTEASAGTGENRAIHTLGIGEAPLASILTDAWTANDEPALTIQKVVTGSPTVREVQSVEVTGETAPGASFSLSGTRQISADTRPSGLVKALNDELGPGTIRTARAVGQREWLIYWEAKGATLTLVETDGNLERRPGMIGSFDLDVTATAAAMGSAATLPVLATLKNITTGEIIISEQITIYDPAADLKTVPTEDEPIYDTDGNPILDTDGNPI